MSHLLAGLIEGLMALALFLGALAFAVAVERINARVRGRANDLDI